MILYLDTSVILRFLFNQPPLIDAWGRWQAAYSSELLGVETRRAIDRLRLDQLLDDDGVAEAHQELARVEDTLGTVALDRAVLQRASLAMPTAVKTLDAIHLASAMLCRESRYPSLIFATHDRRQATAARALGFEVVG